MYVCICNKLTENCVRGAAQQGACCVDSAYESLGAKPRCGRCLDTAAEIISQSDQTEIWLESKT